jgi:hypothetical protein
VYQAVVVVALMEKTIATTPPFQISLPIRFKPMRTAQSHNPATGAKAIAPKMPTAKET